MRKVREKWGELVSRLPHFISLGAVPSMVTSGVNLFPGRLQERAKSEHNCRSLKVRVRGTEHTQTLPLEDTVAWPLHSLLYMLFRGNRCLLQSLVKFSSGEWNGAEFLVLECIRGLSWQTSLTSTKFMIHKELISHPSCWFYIYHCCRNLKSM